VVQKQLLLIAAALSFSVVAGLLVYTRQTLYTRSDKVIIAMAQIGGTKSS